MEKPNTEKSITERSNTQSKENLSNFKYYFNLLVSVMIDMLFFVSIAMLFKLKYSLNKINLKLLL